MNSPLPKPTPPVSNDKQQQTVVFDQSQKTQSGQSSTGQSTVIEPLNSDTSSRVPLAQKPDTNISNSDDTMVSAPKPTLPPTSLSALSSMNSNKIPADGNSSDQTQVTTSQMPQKTVLGQPIPQAIRGEATPTAFGKPAPGKNLAASTSTPSSQTQPVDPTNSTATNPAPTLTTQTPTPTTNQSQSRLNPTPGNSPIPKGANIKQENPSIGSIGVNKPSNAPKIATAKNPIMRFLPFIIGGIVLLVIIVFVLSRVFGGGSSTSVSQDQADTTTQQAGSGSSGQTSTRTEVPSKKVILQYWGLWEPSDVMDQVISDFENENPGIEVNYVKQSPIDYRERLQTAIQSGSGPDIFRFHASWVPMLKNDLDPIPSSIVSSSDFRNNYYPVVTEQLVYQGQYVGLPLMYDGLVLYYNEDILDTADETPPTTWSELRTLAVKLTVPSADGIQRGGLAIGNATNVEHFSDILATLILQNGGNLTDAASVETRDALLFYTNFQKADKVWNETLPSSTVAFARGDVAMMFAPSWRAHEIKALNPDLKFATAPMPQLSENEKITWASYWAEGISAESKNSDQAATFLKYLNKPEVLQKFFSSASKVRAFGEIYPKVDMADELASDKVINAVLEDAAYSKNGYMNSFTHDNGINDLTIGYYKAAIDEMIGGADAQDVQTALDKGVKQVLKQYGVSTQ